MRVTQTAHIREIGRDPRRWVVWHSDPDSRQPVIPLRDDLWPEALRIAAEQGVLYVIHERLQTATVRVPEQSLWDLTQCVLRQTLCAYQTKRFLGHLGQHLNDLPDFMVFKGYPLAMRLYADPLQRAVGDVDLLVRREEGAAWMSFLGGLGYVPRDPGTNLRSFQETGEIMLQNAAAGMPQYPVAIELHWELLNSRKSYIWPTAVEGAWEHREVVLVHDQPVPVMGLRDLLPYLAFHQLLHRHVRLQWVLDVVLLVRRHAEEVFDEEALVLLDANPAVKACVWCALHYAHALFGLPEAETTLTRLRPSKRSCYGWAPLLHPREFLDQRAHWPSLKIAVFREVIKRGAKQRHPRSDLSR